MGSPPSHLPLPGLGALGDPHLSRQLSEQYGPVFTVHLGRQKTVVLTGYEAVREALVGTGQELADRPPIAIFQLIQGGRGRCVLGEAVPGRWGGAVTSSAPGEGQGDGTQGTTAPPEGTRPEPATPGATPRHVGHRRLLLLWGALEGDPPAHCAHPARPGSGEGAHGQQDPAGAELPPGAAGPVRR